MAMIKKEGLTVAATTAVPVYGPKKKTSKKLEALTKWVSKQSGGREGLVPKKVTVERDGKKFEQTRWVRPEDARAGDDDSKRDQTEIPAKDKEQADTETSVDLNKLQTDFPRCRFVGFESAKPEHLAQMHKALSNMPKELKADEGNYYNSPQFQAFAGFNSMTHNMYVNFDKINTEGPQALAEDNPTLHKAGVSPLEAALTHELGHKWAQYLDGKQKAKIRALRKREQGITQYADTNLEEYVAESVTYYFRAPRELETKCPKMYKFLSEVMTSDDENDEQQQQ